jgi:uncharacterized RDD family membrane protein YckC
MLVGVALLAAVPGCVPPTVESTGVFADVWDGRLVLVLNLVKVVEKEQRFAIYYSGKRDLREWTLAGTYGGRARAAAVQGGMLWVFLEDKSGGRAFARTYPLPGGSTDAPAAETGADAAPARVEELPFPWAPRAACRDAEGALWVAGVHEGRIAAARLAASRAADDAVKPSAARETWDASLPPGPRLVAAAVEPPKRKAGSRSRSKSASADADRPAPTSRVRISVGGVRDGVAGGGRKLFAFWSVTDESDAAEAVRGASLAPDGSAWRALSEYALEHKDFCAAPSADGTPGLVLRRYVEGLGAKRKVRPHRVELSSGAEAWSAPEDVSAARQRFLFGYAPRAAWVQWEGGQLLVRTNTQRVELLERSGGGWRAVVPAGFIALYLMEIQTLLLAAGAFLLVIVGGAVFGLRMRRFGKPRERPASARPEGLPRLAPIFRRAVAAMLDVIVVSGVAFSLVGQPGAPTNPLIPDPRPVFLHLGVIAALAVYGAVTEALFGATPGKLALGLRVELAGGGRLGVGRAIVRNVLRPVDIVPPYLGAVGLSLMTVTGLRQRLGDLAAGTVVVVAGYGAPHASPDDDGGKRGGGK